MNWVAVRWESSRPCRTGRSAERSRAKSSSTLRVRPWIRRHRSALAVVSTVIVTAAVTGAWSLQKIRIELGCLRRDGVQVMDAETGAVRLWRLDSVGRPPAELVSEARLETGMRVIDGTVADDPEWQGPSGP